MKYSKLNFSDDDDDDKPKKKGSSRKKSSRKKSRPWYKDISHALGGAYHWTKDTGENAGDQVTEFATGFGPGIKFAAGSAYNDLSRLGMEWPEHLGLTKKGDAKKVYGDFRTDDIGKAMWKDTKRFYGPLAKGDFAQFGHNWQDQPITPILDVSAIFSGGAAGAGKLGEFGAASKSASLSRAGAKIAGLETPVKPLSLTELVSPSNRGMITKSGDQLVSKKYRLSSPDDPNLFTDLPLARNPAKRLGTYTREKALASIPTDRYFGANRRIVRRNERAASRSFDRELARYEAGLGAKIAKLNKHERAAFHAIAQGFNSIERLDTYLAHRAGQLHRATTGEINDAIDTFLAPEAKGFLKTEIESLSSPKVKAQVETPSARLQAVLAEAKNTEGRIGELLEGMGVPLKNIEQRRHLPYRMITGQDHPEPDSLITVSHYVDPADKKLSLRVGASRNPKTPAQAKRNEGRNFENARFKRGPKVVFDAHRSIFKANAQRQKWERLLSQATEIDAKDYHPDKWDVLGDNPAFEKYAQEISRFVRDDAPELLDGDEALQRVTGFFDEALKKRSKNGEGKILVVPRGVMKEMVPAMRDESKFLRRFDQGTQVWRNLALAYHFPGYTTQNVLGQNLLLGLSYPGKIAPAMLARMFESRAARKTETAALKNAAPEVFESSFFRQMGDDGILPTEGKLGAFQRGADIINEFTARVSDDKPRMAAMRIEMRGLVKDYQKQYKRATGKEVSEKTAMRRMIADEKVMDEVAEKVAGKLIDFTRGTDVERVWLRRLAPFILWMTLSTRRAGRMWADEPVLVEALAKFGEYGVDENERRYGDLPSFLKGSIYYGKPKDGKVRAYHPQFMNPLQTPASIAGMLTGAGGGGNPLTNMNPLLKSGFEALSNRDAFYGTPIDYDGSDDYLTMYLKQLRNSVPHYRALKQAFELNDKRDYTPLFTPKKSGILSSWAGVPWKEVDLETARKRAKDEKKGKRPGVS